MAVEQPHTIYLGESAIFLLTVEDADSGERLDLSTYTDLQWEVKAAEGDADPPFLAKALGAGITLRLQSGTTLGQAELAIETSDTTTNPDWPSAPGNVGVFRYDLIGVTAAGNRDVLVAPSDFTVQPVVNTP